MKERISSLALVLLSVRENYSEHSIATLYDPDKMPDDLREAHRNLDLAVEECYRKKPFENDEDRLDALFKLYEKMTGNQNA